MSRQAYTARLMNDALATSTDRAGALARFAEQIAEDDAEALARALDEALAQRRNTQRAAKRRDAQRRDAATQ